MRSTRGRGGRRSIHSAVLRPPGVPHALATTNQGAPLSLSIIYYILIIYIYIYKYIYIYIYIMRRRPSRRRTRGRACGVRGPGHGC